MASNTSYGAVEEGEADKSFDEKNTYYLKEKTLTGDQKIRKLTAVAVPILIAVVIVGGAALFLLKDFGSLYPGRNGGKEPSSYVSSRSDEYPEITEAPDSITKKTKDHSTHSSSSPPNKYKKDPSFVASSCIAHAKCNGLVGDCCPSKSGTFLNCCDSN